MPGLQFVIFLTQPLEGWDYKPMQPHRAKEIHFQNKIFNPQLKVPQRQLEAADVAEVMHLEGSLNKEKGT